MPNSLNTKPVIARSERRLTTTEPPRLSQTSRSAVGLPRGEREERIRCHKCGSLFSSDGNPECSQFDESDEAQQGLCGPGEVCLVYTWQKSRSD